MIIWLIAMMICFLYGVKMDIVAKCVCIPLSFLESITEAFLLFCFVDERIKK